MDSRHSVLSLTDQPAHLAGRAIPSKMPVSFQDVRFGYKAIGRDVLKGVSFDIPAGRMVALVGHAGAGKRSCAHLLLRRHEVEGGAVRIGHTDIRDLPPATLRDLVSLAPQADEPGDACLLDHFRQARPGVTFEEIEAAARQAQVHEVIAALPQGYETPMRSEQLTAGERQRISIARTMLGKAQIVILHETASRLNAADAQALQTALSHLRRGRTVLLISHRLSTLKLADNIVVIEQGVVVEEGRHDHLVAWNDRYTRLLETQVIRN
jgi:ATP-binding cassette subfamily C protein CydCD